MDLCVYPPLYYDCEGNCINDVDGDGICDELEEVGCIDPTNPGFNPFATDSDPTLCLDSRMSPAICLQLRTGRRLFGSRSVRLRDLCGMH